MPRSARIAFVGAGNHSSESLYPNIAHIPEFDLVAVCDIDEAKAKRNARRFGALEMYTDVDKMLSETQLQGVCICGPPKMHHTVGMRCLSHSIPIFIEKPPASDLKRAKELANAARENETFGMVGFMKRFAPANLVTKEFISKKEFGKFSSITLIHGCGPYGDTRAMLNFNGIHMIDLARFFAGDVEEVHAYTLDPSEQCKAVCVNLQFNSGVAGQLNMNSGHTWKDCFEQVYISGMGAGILIDASRAVEVMSDTGRFAEGEGLHLYGWSNRYYVSGNMAGWWAGGHYTRGYWGELSRFARACLGIDDPSPNLNDGVEAMRLIEAIMVSLKREQPTSIKEI